jgi:superfamily II DNA or RNA helicase
MLRTGRTPYGDWGREARQRKDRFRWNPAIGFIVMDEAHRAAGLTSKNSEMAMAAKRQGIPTLLLSATLADTPLELKAAGYVLGLHDGDERNDTLATFHNRVDPFYNWARRHGCGPGAFSAFEFRGTAAQQAAHMAKINSAIIPERGARTRIADLGDAFPETQITAELFEPGDAAKVDALYAEMADALAVLRERTDQYSESAFSRLLKARQEVELIKVPIAVELATDAIAQGRSVAIFINFRATVEELCRRLKTTCFIDGSQVGENGARERQANIDDFNYARSRSIICNNDAGGVGVNLHHIFGPYPHDAIIFPGYSAKTFRQVTGRVWREGALSKSLQRALFLAGTCEVGVAKQLERKIGRLDALNDADLMPA